MEVKIVVILGPTASGKTACAIELAKKFNGEVISADSRQVYKGLNIGTGKITKRKMQGIPHHLIDVANPKKRFTVVDFQKMAREKISEIFSRGRLPIICGGTGFYIDALINNITIPDVPPIPSLREKIRLETSENLLVMLKKLDPVRHQTVDQKNPRRIIRAIEIASVLGKVPPFTRFDLVNKVEPCYETLTIGLSIHPKKLKEKIAIRLFARIREGMIAESTNLHLKGLSWKRMLELGLEYRYLALHLQGQISKQEMIEKLQTEIWRYAKRQMTWFKRDKSILWFDPDEQSKIEQEIKGFLRK